MAAVRGMGSTGRTRYAEEERLRTMVQEYYEAVRWTARCMGATPADADDVAQQAFIEALRNLDAIRPGCERSYLLRAAVRRTERLNRCGWYRFEVSDASLVDATPDETAWGPDDLVELEQSRSRLDRVLRTLPDAARVVFVLVELEGRLLRETCDLLGVPMGTVASRLRRTRRKVKQAFRATKDGVDDG